MKSESAACTEGHTKQDFTLKRHHWSGECRDCTSGGARGATGGNRQVAYGISLTPKDRSEARRGDKGLRSDHQRINLIDKDWNGGRPELDSEDPGQEVAAGARATDLLRLVGPAIWDNTSGGQMSKLCRISYCGKGIRSQGTPRFGERRDSGSASIRNPPIPQ